MSKTSYPDNLGKSTMKGNSVYRLALFVAVGSLLVSSCSTRASDTDDRIESSFKKTHVYKTQLREDSIKAKSKDGAVVLSGTVVESSHKSLAQDTMESLPGVKSVDNRLKVTGKAPAEYSDTWLETKVHTALLFHRNVSTTATDVFVKDGVVSLRGKASSQAQKDLTAEYAGDVEGVKSVKNEMTITEAPDQPEMTTGEKMDDASVTAQVKWSLLAHRSTSALKTHVETTDGVVTLTGVAKNPAEKSLVTKLVGDINGVERVVNNMTVGSPVSEK